MKFKELKLFENDIVEFKLVGGDVIESSISEFIFNNDVIVNFEDMKKLVDEKLKGIEKLNLYVDSLIEDNISNREDIFTNGNKKYLTAEVKIISLTTVIKCCYKHNIELTVYHYNSFLGVYEPQVIFERKERRIKNAN